MTSLFSLKRALYEGLPRPARTVVEHVPFGWLAGRAYRARLADGPGTDALKRPQVEALAERLLGATLRAVVRDVPAYRPFASIVERSSPVEALQAFPLIDKDTVIAAFDDYLADPSVRPRHYETTTGGTSGRQLRILLPDDSQSVETAFMHRQWHRVGYRDGARKATFRGVAFPGAARGEFWQPNPIYREMQFSPMAMSESNLPAYWQHLVDYQPRFLHGYPSAIATLARFVETHGLDSGELQVKAALLGSEGCTDEQRVVIERAFRTRAYTWYGHSERLVLGGECEKSPAYHQFPDYGWLEILDENGNAVGVGERGEIVGTGFLNGVMPLVRYRTGDFATRLDWRCECGRAWDRFDAVEGHRKQQMLVGRGGALLSLAALNVHGPQFARVARYQYFQDTPGCCEIRVVVDPAFTERDRQLIAAAYARKVGDEMRFDVRVVPELALSSRGKFRLLVSELDPETAAVAVTTHEAVAQA